MRNLENLSHEDAQKSGWKILKPLNCEVVGKAVLEDADNGITIMKSTKRFPVFSKKPSPDGEKNWIIGYIYNTSTEIHKGEQVSVAEALVFVPEP